MTRHETPCRCGHSGARHDLYGVSWRPCNMCDCERFVPDGDVRGLGVKVVTDPAMAPGTAYLLPGPYPVPAPGEPLGAYHRRTRDWWDAVVALGGTDSILRLAP